MAKPGAFPDSRVLLPGLTQDRRLVTDDLAP